MNEKRPLVAFFHIAKTAGTTFKFILGNSFGPSFCDTMMCKPRPFDEAELRFAGRLFPSLRGIGGHSVGLRSAYPNHRLFTITFLREPIARTISNYQHYCAHYLKLSDLDACLSAFEPWIQSPANRDNQTRKLDPAGSHEHAKRLLDTQFDIVGITERFDECLQVIQARCPHRLDLRYTRKQKAGNTGLKDALLGSERYRGLLADATSKDGRLYRFAVDELLPRQSRDVRIDTTLSYEVLRHHWTWRYLLSLWYNKGVYRSMAKRRRGTRH